MRRADPTQTLRPTWRKNGGIWWNIAFRSGAPRPIKMMVVDGPYSPASMCYNVVVAERHNERSRGAGAKKCSADRAQICPARNVVPSWYISATQRR